jgi:hypothetical protein
VPAGRDCGEGLKYLTAKKDRDQYLNRQGAKRSKITARTLNRRDAERIEKQAFFDVRSRLAWLFEFDPIRISFLSASRRFKF